MILKHQEGQDPRPRLKGPIFTAQKFKDLYQDELLETDFPNSEVTAGYEVPATDVYVLGPTGRFLTEYISAKDKKTLIKIQHKIWQLEQWDEVTGKNVPCQGGKRLITNIQPVGCPM